MTAPFETKDLAYKTWVRCGQNLSECHRQMNGHEGYFLSRATLYEWMMRYDWQGRATRLEAEQAMLSNATSDDAILSPLLKQKARYEKYFDGLGIGSVDNQAIYGYNAILKTILDIRESISIRRKEGEIDASEVGFIIRTPSDAVTALSSAVSNKLNSMLVNPGAVSLKGVRELEKALVLIDKMRAKYQAVEKSADKQVGLSDEAADMIKKQILGVH